jgi:hypothetical protein
MANAKQPAGDHCNNDLRQASLKVISLHDKGWPRLGRTEIGMRK